jgi:hypothetical protein
VVLYVAVTHSQMSQRATLDHLRQSLGHFFIYDSVSAEIHPLQTVTAFHPSGNVEVAVDRQIALYSRQCVQTQRLLHELLDRVDRAIERNTVQDEHL